MVRVARGHSLHAGVVPLTLPSPPRGEGRVRGGAVVPWVLTALGHLGGSSPTFFVSWPLFAVLCLAAGNRSTSGNPNKETPPHGRTRLAEEHQPAQSGPEHPARDHLLVHRGGYS